MHAELVCSLPDQLPDFVNVHDLYRQGESHRPFLGLNITYP
jgi:hypothetical protein